MTTPVLLLLLFLLLLLLLLLLHLLLAWRRCKARGGNSSNYEIATIQQPSATTGRP